MLSIIHAARAPHCLLGLVPGLSDMAPILYRHTWNGRMVNWVPTLHNILTSGPYFGIAEQSQNANWYLKTGFDFRGYSGSFTLAAAIYADMPDWEQSRTRVGMVCGQGRFASSAQETVWGIELRQFANYAPGTLHLFVRLYTENSTYTPFIDTGNAFCNRWGVLVLCVDQEHNRMRIWLNGSSRQLGTATGGKALNPSAYMYESFCLRSEDDTISGNIDLPIRIRGILLFDQVLSDAEITAISKILYY